MSLQTDIGDRNVEQLLSTAYRPEAIDPGFVQETQDKLRLAARELAQARRQTIPMTPTGPAPDYTRLRRRLGWGMALAAALACVYLVYRAGRHHESRLPGTSPNTIAHTKRKDFSPAAGTTVGLTARPRPSAPPASILKLGETLSTKAGEKRRVVLEDGSVLFINQDSQLRQVAPRHVELSRGEVYVEVAPREAGSGETFVVGTPDRKVSALGTRFSVQATPKGSGVLVTQGKVRVSDLERPLGTGEQLSAGSNRIVPAPRATHELDWTRDLMAAAESPLVPCAKHGGGALLAIDPSGQEVRLTLRKFHVDVHIEDGFARTTIDQTYFNNESWRLEGTFYFPLPPDASLSRLAMYVEDGDSSKLNEGGMAERNHAREVYETILHQRRDPALLEWVDGSTFKMRVFPLEGRKEKRIVLSYTQRLSSLYGNTRYRFPTGHTMELVRDWSFHGRVKHGAELRITSPSHPDDMTIAPKVGDMILDAWAKNTKPEKDVVIEILDRADDRELARFNTSVHEKYQYLMLRYRPELAAESKPRRRDWVILFEAGANRDPLLARAQIEVVKHLLENAEHEDTFTLFTANTRVHFFDKNPRPATPKNVDEAVAWLDTAHLIGALDLNHALEAAAPALQAAKNAHLVHVGAGVPALGERNDDVLAKRFPEGTRYVGIGVGKKWNRAFMKMAAERSRGYFAQINPDESIAWKTFDLLATLNTPRLMDLRVVDAAEKAVFLSESLTLTQGEEVCAITRIDAGKGETLPAQVIVSGKLDGKPFTRTLDVAKAQPGADYLPRTWAKLEIDRLLADGAEKNKETITKLSMASYVMSPFTSLLVLETEEDYRKFNVDRGRKDHWAMYPCPDRIPTIFEPDALRQAWLAPRDAEGKRTVEQVLATILVRPTPRFLQLQGREEKSLPECMTASHFYHGNYAVPEPSEHWFFNLGDSGLAWSEDGKALSRLKELEFNGWFAPFGGEGRMTLPELELLNESLRRFAGAESASMKAKADSLIQFAPVFFDKEMQWAAPRGVKEFDSRELSREEWGTLPLRDRDLAKDKLGLISGLTPDGELVADLRIPIRSSSFDFKSLNGNFNTIDFFPPSLALTVRAPVRMHTSISDGVDGGKIRRDLFFLEDRQSLPIGLGAGTRATYASPFADQITYGKMVEDVVFEDLVPQEKLAPPKAREILLSRFLASRLNDTAPGRHLIFSRPRFEQEQRLFGDLTLYAPGLQTWRADIEATLEREAKREKPIILGSIDEQARKLIERARSAGWETITFDDRDLPFQVTYDGRGRFQYERMLSTGLREEVVGDGAYLWHLYREIGLAGQRAYGRHYFEVIANLVPWLLPEAGELARAGDVKLIQENVIALIPRRAGTSEKDAAHQLHLVFEKDRLAERRLVEIPSGRVMARETYDADGMVRVLDEGGRAVAERKLGRVQASAPSLTLDTKDLLVIRFPVRTSQYFYESTRTERTQAAKMARAQAEDIFVSDCWGNGGNALGIFAERFHSQGDRRLGFYTLLNACGVRIAPDNTYTFHDGVKTIFEVVKEHPDSPLARYLDHNQVLKAGRSPMPYLGTFAGEKDSFLNRLGRYRDLATMWTWGQMGAPGTEELKANGARTIRALKDCSEPLWAWAVLEAAQQRASSTEFQLALGEALKDLGERTGLFYSARYQHASSLYSAGKGEEAKKLFLALHEEAFKDGMIPPIDSTFRVALNHGAPEGTIPFAQFVRERHGRLVKERRFLAALSLTWQTHQIGEQALAGELFLATTNSAREQDRNLVRLAGLEFLWHTGQLAYADSVLGKVLEDPVIADNPVVWRVAAHLAQRRGFLAKAVTATEKAMDLEYQHLPEIINLETVRNDYRGLLNQYQQMATAYTLVESEAPKELIARVIKTADRWRSLDHDNMEVPEHAARIIQLLGARELAWDYLTTPIGMKPGEAEPWLRLAGTLKEEAQFELADRAYAAAYQAEPTNADILWQRAQNLQALGRMEQARVLFAQIADGSWQPRFRWLQDQAKGLR